MILIFDWAEAGCAITAMPKAAAQTVAAMMVRFMAGILIVGFGRWRDSGAAKKWRRRLCSRRSESSWLASSSDVFLDVKQPFEYFNYTERVPSVGTLTHGLDPCPAK